MRLARPSDVPALAELWQLCFGDPAETAGEFLESNWEHILVFQTRNASAMLTAMPVSWQGHSAAYLYAVGTHPDHRGQGLCRELMAFAEKELYRRGFCYTILSPAEPSLFKFYGKMGYYPSFFAEHREFTDENSDLSAVSVSAAEYGRLRESRDPNAVLYPEWLLKLQESFGTLLRIGETGCAAVERHGESYLVRELLADDPAAAAAAVCRYCGLPKITCKIPGKTPYGMAKPLLDLPLCPSWLGLAFE